MEHALGEGMVLDIFKEVLLQTLPADDPRVPDVRKKLTAICREEEEHVAWGEKETRRILAESPWLRTPFYGLLEMQLAVVPYLVRAFEKRAGSHPVLRHVPGFVAYVRERMYAQGRALGFVPEERPGALRRGFAMAWGAALFVRSQFARSSSRLEHIYLQELGFSR
jgi:hypothetical protein